MFHPRRSLQDLVDGELSDRRRSVVEHHLQVCDTCSNDVRGLREHKGTLLGLGSPSPDPEFQRRLLSTGPGPSTGSAPDRPGLQPDRAATIASPKPSRRLRLVAAAGGSAVLAAAVLTGAYVVGSGSDPAAGAEAGSTTPRAGWEETFRGTPAALDADQVEVLRTQGWSCPGLTTLGLTLRSAEGLTIDGLPTLELVLEHDGDRVTVYEQRAVDGRRRTPPTNAVTGRTVAEDGFEHVGGLQQDLWVHSGEPWTVVLRSSSATYTVVSELPPADMPRTLQQLVTTEYAQLPTVAQPRNGSTIDRIMRGLSIMVHPQDP
ncbi:hypothetical protein E8P82_10395 [Arthrobacter echini]|uniref:Putative zinc-finger domain-containing protein n=1 Tax=Arthrobacter echini TaxID=1529066 RepID=A0A4S5E3S0_9MICC|nr:zf-HC2 domain-containing protein [Arthrobacter echini]THJ66033.1 hypothetical protein E8P82_10395 [Arthrobacter echini]